VAVFTSRRANRKAVFSAVVWSLAFLCIQGGGKKKRLELFLSFWTAIVGRGDKTRALKGERGCGSIRLPGREGQGKKVPTIRWVFE